MPWAYVVSWKEYFVPGARLLSDFCVPAPVCETCVVTLATPDPDECSTTIAPNVPGCDTEYDPECLPVWVLEGIVAEWDPLCDVINASYPDLCSISFDDITAGQTIPFVGFGICCLLDCLAYFIGKRAGDCVTLADLPETAPGDWTGTDEEWARCRAFMRQYLLVIWPNIGQNVVNAYCLDQALPPLFGSDEMTINYQLIQLPAGSYLTAEGCDTISADGCSACPPAA